MPRIKSAKPVLQPRKETSHSLLKENHPSLHTLLTKKGNQKAQDIFRNIIKNLTQRRHCSEKELREIVKTAAERALDLDLKQYTPKSINFHDQKPTTFPCLFANGAKMQIIVKPTDRLLDARIKSYFSYRMVVCPSEEELKNLTNFERKELNELLNGDYDRSTIGSIGYFAFSIHSGISKKESQIIVWTRQTRATPSFSKNSQNRYRNWDMELLRHLEALAKVKGINRLLFAYSNYLERTYNAEAFIRKTKPSLPEEQIINIARKKGFMEQYRPFFNKLSKVGYSTFEVPKPDSLLIYDTYLAKEL